MLILIVCLVDWSPNGMYLASASFDATICIWDKNSGGRYIKIICSIIILQCGHLGSKVKVVVNVALKYNQLTMQSFFTKIVWNSQHYYFKVHVSAV